MIEKENNISNYIGNDEAIIEMGDDVGGIRIISKNNRLYFTCWTNRKEIVEGWYIDKDCFVEMLCKITLKMY